MPDQDAYQKRIAEAMRPSSECPSIGDLAQLLETRATRLEAHVKDCARCKAELSLLQGFLAAEPAQAEAADVRALTDEVRRRVRQQIRPAAPPAWWRRWLAMPLSPRFAMAAASVLILAGISIYVSQMRNPALGPGLPSGADTYRSQSIRLETPKGEIAVPPAALLWQPVPGANRYVVTLMEVDRNEIWTQNSNSARADLPSSIQAKALPGKTLLWQVTAFDRAGSKIAESGIEKFRVTVRR